MGPGAAAALNMGTELVGAQYTAYKNKKAQERAYKFNKEFWREQFDTTNKYNHPVQQRARMEQAGLNPALMYGQNAGGASGQASPSRGADYVAEKFDMANLALISAQIKNITSDAKLKDQQTATERERTVIENLKSQFEDQYWYTKGHKLVQEAALAAANADKARSEAIIARLKKDFAEEGIFIDSKNWQSIVNFIFGQTMNVKRGQERHTDSYQNKLEDEYFNNISLSK